MKATTIRVMRADDGHYWVCRVVERPGEDARAWPLRGPFSSRKLAAVELKMELWGA